MSKALKWLEEESDRLEKECNENSDPHKTVNNSFLEGFNYALVNARAFEEVELDDNQKIVFEWLKSTWKSHRRNNWSFPFSFVGNAVMEMPADIYDFYDDFTEREEFELLIAFGFWGLEQEEAE